MERNATELEGFVREALHVSTAIGVRLAHADRIAEIARHLEVRGLLVLRYREHVLIVSGPQVYRHMTEVMYEREWRKGWGDGNLPTVGTTIEACVEACVKRENKLRDPVMRVSEVFARARERVNEATA